ncbi:hypothetical protein [Marinospirillum alkaliphilum]|uniref:Uncharacterized protein n=1 Tax=Marinospirillum alkaliphilum DSM 21637 TaxID=1122209 RepID=A0A1K1XI80_9GAMM|nr:hypothetical protein [Marinospirillum alkaliphilum]SFX49091.1 hypothetical protein SAMN02745752_01840 [Marinospirillum alkaliphilum DSM 21637]
MDDDWRKLAQKPEDRHKKIPERRRRRDPLLNLISIFGAVSWVLMLPILFLVEQARPEMETFFDRMLGLKVRPSWDETAYYYAFFLMLAVLLLAGFGLLLNSLRNRRKTDSIRINLVVVFTLSLLGVLHYLIRFVF